MGIASKSTANLGYCFFISLFTLDPTIYTYIHITTSSLFLHFGLSVSKCFNYWENKMKKLTSIVLFGRSRPLLHHKLTFKQESFQFRCQKVKSVEAVLSLNKMVELISTVGESLWTVFNIIPNYAMIVWI